MRKIILSVAIFMTALALASCNIPADSPSSLTRSQSSSSAIASESDTPSEVQTSPSPFEGVWFCSRANSCNDMEITLTITQSDGQLYFERKMVSPTGSGGSNLSGSAKMPSDNQVFASYTKGTYTLDEDSLTEYFESDNKQNTYTRKMSASFTFSPENSQSTSSKTIPAFTNKFGTATTLCNHSGCSNYIASSGDTNCCTTHSNKCLECSKYIDEDAAWCMSCIETAANQVIEEKNKIKNEDCDICKKPATETINGEYFCDKHYSGALEWYLEQGKKK